MLERTGIWLAVISAVAAGCAASPEPVETPQPPSAPVAAPAGPAEPQTPKVSAEAARAEEARALVAQAETDVQRARGKRALWSSAWEDLVESRQALAAGDHAKAARHARRASEYALLGLEQLAYPPVK